MYYGDKYNITENISGHDHITSNHKRQQIAETFSWSSNVESIQSNRIHMVLYQMRKKNQHQNCIVTTYSTESVIIPAKRQQ